MRKLAALVALGVFALCLQAQPPAGGGGGRGRGPAAPAKNLKVLTDDDLRGGAMRMATVGLGVQCGFCHVDDRASDEKQEKVMARMMFASVKELNSHIPEGATKVTCYMCHRGAEKPLAAPPAAAPAGQ